jgi:hypothetical protein
MRLATLPHVPAAMMFCHTTACSNGASQPWTETSKIMTQNQSSPPSKLFPQIFVTAMKTLSRIAYNTAATTSVHRWLPTLYLLGLSLSILLYLMQYA